MAVENAVRVKFRGRTFNSPRRAFRQVGLSLRKDLTGNPEDLKKTLRAYIDLVIDSLIAKHSGKYPRGTTDNTLSRRSGGLIETIRESAIIKGRMYHTMQGLFRLEGIMVIHEFGGTIRSKGKMLTIPLKAAMNKDGTPKKQSAREWKRTFVAETKAGNLVIFQRRGRKIVPLYVLRDEVYIPPRLGMREMVQEKLPYFVERAADNIVQLSKTV